MSIRAIELFCCAGGMAEGFRRAGIVFDQAFDYDTDACDSYERNHGHRPIQVDIRDVVRLVAAGWSPGAVDLIVADPPCTPWSRAGKRQGLADERDMLAETCQLIAQLQPQAWLIGNVPGLDDSTNAGALDATIGKLALEWGYHVDYARLDSADYGVPQHRVRPFWFGHRVGTHCLRWPEPTHGPPHNLHLPGFELVPWVTCRQALGHLPPDELGRPVRVRWKRDTDHKLSHPDEPGITQTRNANGDGALLALSDALPTARRKRSWSNAHPPSELEAPAKAITTVERAGHGGGGSVLLALERHPMSRPDEPAYAITTKGDDRGAQGGGVLQWPWDRPSTTVTCRDTIPPPGHHPESGSILTLPNAVVLSEKARAILQGFPETWHFAGKTKASRSSQLGMAMPPPLAQAVALSIVRWFVAQEPADA